MRIHLATICNCPEVRVLSAAPSEAEMERRLAAYVGQNGGHVLWPARSKEVLRLLEEARWNEAISLYFASVGDRWDREFLHAGAVELQESPHGFHASITGPGRRVRGPVLRDL